MTKLDKLTKKLEKGLEAMSDNERAFSMLICRGILACNNKNGATLDYLDYHLYHCLANRKSYDYLKKMKIYNNTTSIAVFFLHSLELLQQREIIKRTPDGSYRLIL